MKSQHVNGISVVSIGTGERIGSISELLLDLDAKRVAAFVLGGSSGMTGGVLSSSETPPPQYVPADQVHAIGPDAMTVQDGSVVQETGPVDDIIPLSELTKRKVVTEGGTYVGQIASVEIDENSMKLTHLEVSPGFFKSNQMVDTGQIITVGPEMLIVDNAVCEDPAPAHDQAMTDGMESDDRGVIVIDDQRSDRVQA